MKKRSILSLVLTLSLMFFSLFSLMGNMFLGIIIYGIFNVIYWLLYIQIRKEEKEEKNVE